MRWLHLPLLLFLASCCLAQDGISPDTLFPLADYTGYYSHGGFSFSTWYTTSPDVASAFQGTYEYRAGCDTIRKGRGFTSGIIGAASSAYFGGSSYSGDRGLASFNTNNIITSMQVLDSVNTFIHLDEILRQDGDSLFAVACSIQCVDDCDVPLEACVADSCNFWRCGQINWADTCFDFYASGVTGWVEFDIPTSYIKLSDTTTIGFVTRMMGQGYAPTGFNFFSSALPADTTAMMIYYFSPKYNDISHQDNADGISPDTIQFICSVALEEISTPGFWSQNEMAWYDAFHGIERSYSDTTWPCWTCDSGYVGQWNYAMQPHVEASEYGTGVDWMRRAYFLMELEQAIPDTTELDSMRLYLKFDYVHVDEGDSLFAVTYTPRDTSGDCSICYGCTYPVITEGGGSPPTRWCNFYQCGAYYIWGDIPDRSYGRVPQYLGWTWFPIHPDIIDFSTASVGDTFGVGLILKDWSSSAPTDTNDVSIGTGVDCPYIVYYFSKPPPDTLAGFINWGLRPPHLGWGLPINQARGMYGGGKGR